MPTILFGVFGVGLVFSCESFVVNDFLYSHGWVIYCSRFILSVKDFFMATFINYKDSPLFVSPNDGVPETGVSLSHLIAASSCDLTFDAALDPAKYIGKSAVSDDFHVNAAKATKLAFSYTPLVGPALKDGVSAASTGIFNLTGDSSCSIRLGNFLFRQCYLDSLTLSINPNQPIRVNANFSCYNESGVEGLSYLGLIHTGGFTSDTSSGTAFSALHALASSVSGQSVSLPESKTEISIQTTCSRTPVYEVGSTYPRTVLLNSVTRQTSVNGENIGTVIRASGNGAVLNLKLAEFGKLMDPTFNAAIDYRVRFDITGKVTSQNLSAQVGRTLEGGISIVENIY